MSKIFFDDLVILDDVDKEIKNISETLEEKEELWRLVDEIVNHRVMIGILDHLPHEHHHEFLTNFYESPHNESHLTYLNERIEDKIEDVITKEIDKLKEELLQEIKTLKSKK